MCYKPSKTLGKARPVRLPTSRTSGSLFSSLTYLPLNMNLSIISFLLLLSLVNIVIAGPLSTPRHVVDVRLDQQPADDRLPSASPNWHLVDEFSMDHHGSDSVNNDLELTSGADDDVTLRSRNNMAIQRRKGKVKGKGKGSSSGDGGTAKMDKAAKVTGDLSKAASVATEALQEVPILGEAMDIVTTLLKVLSKVFSAVAAMEKKSDEVSPVLLDLFAL